MQVTQRTPFKVLEEVHKTFSALLGCSWRQILPEVPQFAETLLHRAVGAGDDTYLEVGNMQRLIVFQLCNLAWSEVLQRLGVDSRSIVLASPPDAVSSPLG